MNNKKYTVYSDFDMEQHTKTFVNYLEVIILPTGKVVYAVPSHQEKLIKLAMEKFQCSREEVGRKCPKEYLFDYMNWLCQITGCIAVWNMSYEGKPNRFQRHKLEELKQRGLFKGELSWQKQEQEQ